MITLTSEQERMLCLSSYTRNPVQDHIPGFGNMVDFTQAEIDAAVAEVCAELDRTKAERDALRAEMLRQAHNFDDYANDQENSISKGWIARSAVEKAKGKVFAWRDAASEIRKALGEQSHD